MKGLYSSYDDALEFLSLCAHNFPNYVKLNKIGQTWEKRDMVVVTVSENVEQADEKPALFYTGTIHAREWIGIELCLGFIEYLINNLEYNPQIQTLLKKTTLYMVPCVNPDGFEYSRNHFSFWRKNRRQNADGSFGVDLNRNFSIGYQASNQPSSNVYSGPEPFSEPETKALKNFVDSHSNITIALDYHSQGNVFFPAHDFRHEDTIDTTDMNILCANMAEEIRKVSAREYGIHQGKPPVKLISGSGREYYYSKGIIATVVEVGTRNISDYLDDMQEHIKEHIPALLVALSETPNYEKHTNLKRVENFKTIAVTNESVELSWGYEGTEDVYFEIFRNVKNKLYCNERSLIARTKSYNFIDTNLQSSTDYFYNIRAVSKKEGVKSPFPPQIHIKTDVDIDEFYRIYYASKAKTGYLGELTPNNKSHFGNNSLFVGINESKGICYSILHFNLETLPQNAIIKSAIIKIYPINRVAATIEKFGEWNVGLVDFEENSEIYDYDIVKDLKISQFIGRPTQSNQLTQGIWRHWKFSKHECSLLQENIQNKEVYFRLEGPKELPLGRNSQMMQWDLGYGKFSQGLNFRPSLEIVYTLEPTTLDIFPKNTYSISQDEVKEEVLECGFDTKGKRIFSTMEYSLSALPDYDYTTITKAHLELTSTKSYLKEDIRFHMEFIEKTIEQDYLSIKNRTTIENIGYDISANELKKQQNQYFVFDSFSLKWLSKYFKFSKLAAFLLKPTSARKGVKNKIVSFYAKKPELSPKLCVSYIFKRKKALQNVTSFTCNLEDEVIKLSWENPDNDDFVGVKVIKNPFREPINAFDGQKLYGGKDNYTFDSFGALDIDKYYAIFTYDNVPNYSEPLVISYQALQKKKDS